MDPFSLTSPGRERVRRICHWMVLFCCTSLLTCHSQTKKPAPATAPRILIAANISTKSAEKVAGTVGQYMNTVTLIGKDITKGPILNEINSDDGPLGTGGKPSIKIFYSMTHGAIDDVAGGPGGPFLGPLIPNENPQTRADRHIAYTEINLPPNHPGYQLVFINGCRSLDNYEMWKMRFRAAHYIGWRNLGFKPTADTVQVVFADAVAAYFKKVEEGNPPAQPLGPFVYDYILKWWRDERESEGWATIQGDLILR